MRPDCPGKQLAAMLLLNKQDRPTETDKVTTLLTTADTCRPTYVMTAVWKHDIIDISILLILMMSELSDLVKCQHIKHLAGLTSPLTTESDDAEQFYRSH